MLEEMLGQALSKGLQHQEHIFFSKIWKWTNSDLEVLVHFQILERTCGIPPEFRGGVHIFI